MQEYTALSTIEAKYVESDQGSNLVAPTVGRYFDEKLNQASSTMHLIRKPIYHVKMKHIEAWFHHIQELITKKKLKVQKIDTEVNITDCLMKPLLEQCFGIFININK